MASERDERFTALDWIAVSMTVMQIAVIVATPLTVSRTFLEMFSSFGDFDELPRLTQLALSPWYGFIAPIIPLALLVWGVVARRPIGWRRAGVVSAFLLSLAVIGLYLFGAYAPIFEIADAVGP